MAFPSRKDLNRTGLVLQIGSASLVELTGGEPYLRLAQAKKVRHARLAIVAIGQMIGFQASELKGAATC